MDELPSDWSIPTWRGIAEPVTMLGLPPEQAALAVFLGGGIAVVLLLFGGLLAAAIAALLLIPGLFLGCRALYASDPWWGEHLTTHRWPVAVWLAR
jgi:hypothetical protein